MSPNLADSQLSPAWLVQLVGLWVGAKAGNFVGEVGLRIGKPPKLPRRAKGVDATAPYGVGKFVYTPENVHVEPKNAGLVQIIFLFQLGDFGKVPAANFSGCIFEHFRKLAFWIPLKPVPLAGEH